MRETKFPKLTVQETASELFYKGTKKKKLGCKRGRLSNQAKGNYAMSI